MKNQDQLFTKLQEIQTTLDKFRRLGHENAITDSLKDNAKLLIKEILLDIKDHLATKLNLKENINFTWSSHFDQDKEDYVAQFTTSKIQVLTTSDENIDMTIYDYEQKEIMDSQVGLDDCLKVIMPGENFKMSV